MEDEQVPAETVEQPKRKGGRPRGSKKAQPEAAFSKDEMKDFLTAAISEMKKPTDLEQAKIDEDKRRRERLARASAEAARREAAETRGRIAACQHRREDEKHTFHGHICSDGYIRGGCLRCEFEFGPVTATQAQRDSGAISLHLITDLTAAQLLAWTADTLKKHPEIQQNQPAWAVA
jgi:hypothetical protein